MTFKIIRDNQFDMEFKAVYTKGKNNKGYRFLMEYIRDGQFHKKGDLVFIYFGNHAFLGIQINFIDVKRGKWVSPNNHFKFKSYNYYYLDIDYKKLETELLNYKMFYNDQMGVFSLNYKAQYEFNNIQY